MSESQLPVGGDIQVAGGKCFTANRWREAILYYLFGIWSGDETVLNRPKINFGRFQLRLDESGESYYAVGESGGVIVSFHESRCLRVGWKKAEVEVALVRFLKDNKIKKLTIDLEQGQMVFWKTDRRAEYGCAAYGIQTMREFINS